MSGGAPFLRAHDVTLALGEREVLRSVRLSARRGEVLGLIGPNGAGKSTLLRMLAGLGLPDRGHVEMEGIPLALFSGSQRARRIAFLPQNAAVPPPMSVEDLVSLGRLPFGARETATDDALIAAALRRTETQELRRRPATSLSGGELARVLLARALAVEAPCLLADEPIAALDPAHALTVMGLFRELARTGCCVVVVLHDLALASRFCDRVALLQEGQLVAEGAACDVMSDTALRAVYGIDVRRVEGAVIPWSLAWE